MDYLIPDWLSLLLLILSVVFTVNDIHYDGACALSDALSSGSCQLERFDLSCEDHVTCDGSRWGRWSSDRWLNQLFLQTPLSEFKEPGLWVKLSDILRAS